MTNLVIAATSVSVRLGRRFAVLRDLWPAALLALGGFATLAWVTVLGWLVLRCAFWLVRSG